MAAIKHFAAPAGMTTPPLSFAARTRDLLFVSGIPDFHKNGGPPDAQSVIALDDAGIQPF